ncbi:ATP-binding protein [Peptoniphilus olsenii]
MEIKSTERRNPITADVFARMNLMERRGSGPRKIIEAYEAEENYKEELKPEFKSTESFFTTILKNLNYDTQNDGQNEDENDGKKLKPKDRRNKMVKLIKKNSNITTIELSHILWVSISTIERDLKVLTDEKMIEYVGSSKDGYWKVNK